MTDSSTADVFESSRTETSESRLWRAKARDRRTE